MGNRHGYFVLDALTQAAFLKQNNCRALNLTGAANQRCERMSITKPIKALRKPTRQVRYKYLGFVLKPYNDFRKSSRQVRYKYLGFVSKRYADKYQDLIEADAWIRQGYRYSSIQNRAIVILATGSVYLPIGKAANTAMKIALTDEPNIDHVLDAAFQNLNHQELSPDTLIHHVEPTGLSSLKECQLNPNDLAKGMRRCFTVVRNPIDRFKSAWSDKVAGEGRRSSLTDSIDRFYNRYKYDGYSIDQLITYIKETPLQFVDGHVCPQWSACGAGRIPFEMVGKVESLESDVRAFAEAGLITRESANRISVRNASNSEAVKLTRKQESQIRMLYAHDFEIFGYD